MIVGIGIDSVEIDRFSDWHTYDRSKLQRIFTPQEIDYCLSNQALSAERFAVRFAAKEAFYKALGGFKPDFTRPFSSIAHTIEIQKNPNVSVILLAPWEELLKGQNSGKNICSLLSLTHTKTTATAFVILEKKIKK